MPTKGGRTAHRVADELFKTTPIGTDRGIDVGKSPLKFVLCDSLCDIFCKYRDRVAEEIIKERPDLSNNMFREALTDIQITSDLLAGGDCVCKCKSI